MNMGMVKPLTFGRMGNFLFQSAAAMAYAWKHGMEYTLPTNSGNPKHNPVYLQHLVNPKWDCNLPEVKVTEQGHGFQEIPFKEEWRGKNIILDGYWQSEKYFFWCRERILETFGFEWRPTLGFVSFHVRRGDYLTLTRKHPPVTLEWMERAMKQFPGYRFTFFSDDLSWCRAIFGNRGDCVFTPGKNEVEDLVGMSHCEHHICSASTFSWWGAWLNRNPNKRILMPNWWFTSNYQGLDTKDIVPANWERL